MSEPNQMPRHLLIIRMPPVSYVAMLPYAVRELRKAYPGLRITIATQEEFAPFFEGMDVEIIPLAVRRKHHGLVDAFRTASRIRSLGVDCLADMNYVPYSMLISFIAWISGIKVRHLHKNRVARWLRIGYSPDDAVPMSHIVLRYCDVFRRLGLAVGIPSVDPVFPQRRNPFGCKTGAWIGFAPFASSANRSYPEPLRTRTVELLSEKYDRVFVHGGDGEEYEFASAMSGRFDNVTAVRDDCDLASELDLISNEDCMIAMDSMVMHLSSLVGAPLVSVWGASHPQFGCVGYGSDPDGVLQIDMKCRPCSSHGPSQCRYGDNRCMCSITPEMIMDKVKLMLAKGRRSLP